MSRQDHRNYDAALERLRREQQAVVKQESISSGDIALWFLAAFMALALFLAAPKLGQEVTVAALFAMACCLVHPISQLSFVRNQTSTVKRRSWFIGLMVLAVAVIVAFGIFVWPPKPYYALRAKDRNKFMDVLKAQKGPKETLVIKCPATNEELCTIATGYLEMFQRAGWKTPTGGIERGFYGKSFPGVSIAKRPQPGTLDPNDPDKGLWVLQSPSIVTVRRAFSEVGIQVNGQADQNLADNTISIYFGPAPEP